MATSDGFPGVDELIQEAQDRTKAAAASAAAGAAGSALTASQIASFRSPIALNTPEPALKGLDDPTTIPDAIKSLLNRPVTIQGKATQALDGRLVRIVVATVRDVNGRTRPGLPVQLLDEKGGNLLDTTYTDPNGLVLTKFPSSASPGTALADLPEVKGVVKVVDGTKDGFTTPVTVPKGSQFAPLDIELAQLPPGPDDAKKAPGASSTGVHAGGGGDGTGAGATHTETPPAPVGLARGDDPLSRLPANFSAALCRHLEDARSRIPDPILGQADGGADDFRKHRTAIIKHLTMPRLGPTDPRKAGAGTEVPRYIVRLRQTWVFLGYTLGEISGVDSLDPGQIVDDALQTVERTLQTATQALDSVTQQATSQLQDTLKSLSSIDATAYLSQTVEAEASLFGWGVGIPGLFGAGGVDAKASVSSKTFASSSVDTSVDVSHLVTNASTFVNNAIRNTTSQAVDQVRNLSRTISSVSPLLSRVTNLLRWNLYENYAVCTEVEDVHKVVSLNIFEKPNLLQVSKASGEVVAPGRAFQSKTQALKFSLMAGLPEITLPQVDFNTPSLEPPTFDAETIVDLRPFFQARLLEPRLMPQFDILAHAVEENLNGGRAISFLEMEVGYSLNLGDATLTASIAGVDTVVPLRMNGTKARARVRLPYPMRAGDIDLLTVSLASNPLGWETSLQNLGFLSNFGIDVTKNNDVRIKRIRIWAGKSPAHKPDFDFVPAGDTLHIAGVGSTDPYDITLSIAPINVDTSRDPLYRHINRNRTFYLGVLAQAALNYPSLRDDVPQIAAVYPGSSALWEMAILGFEADKALVLQDAPADDDFAKQLLADPGSATLVQILAPGAYSEALQGLLKLDDALGKLHPKLAQPAELLTQGLNSAFDITGKNLGVLPQPNGGGGLPGVGNVPGAGNLPTGALPGGGAVPGGAGGLPLPGLPLVGGGN
jgi:hypothetical protein